MCNYSQTLISLQEQVEIDIAAKVKALGKRSKFVCEKTIKIKEENLMFNIDARRYLFEISQTELIDNEGYQYNFDALSIDKLVLLVEYINQL